MRRIGLIVVSAFALSCQIVTPAGARGAVGAAGGAPQLPELPVVASAHVCGTPATLQARCHAVVVVNGKGKAAATTAPSATAYKPADLKGAYNLSGTSTQTIAIVDAYNNPSAESDLAVYRSTFGLGSCTTSNGCFKKIDQRGGTAYPAGNTGWGEEIDLDIEMASAICPTCKITLVEADSNSYADLGAAVDEAAASGAKAISNSYGGGEFLTEGAQLYDGHYNHPGVAITVSTGDSGYGTEFPAASQYVTAAGGTTLRYDRTTGTRTSETAWSGAGSGCSAYIAKPSWQPSVGTCSRRMVADVSAVADPSTGVAVYDTYGSTGGANWYVFGGTSVAAPIIAGVYALAGNASTLNYGSYPYGHAGSLFDITSGSNGTCTNKRTAANAPLCTARTGWDGPTGLGTPNGFTAF